MQASNEFGVLDDCVQGILNGYETVSACNKTPDKKCSTIDENTDFVNHGPTAVKLKNKATVEP